MKGFAEELVRLGAKLPSDIMDVEMEFTPVIIFPFSRAKIYTTTGVVVSKTSSGIFSKLCLSELDIIASDASIALHILGATIKETARDNEIIYVSGNRENEATIQIIGEMVSSGERINRMTVSSRKILFILTP
jgi:hypothetical protein